MQEVTLKVTSDTTQIATTDHTSAISGYLYAVQWTQGTSANTSDITVSTQGGYGSKTVLTLTDATASMLKYPRDLVHDASGNALTGTDGGDRNLPVLDGTPRAVTAQQGESKYGYVSLYYLTKSEVDRMKELTLTLTVAADGTATVNGDLPILGRLYAVYYTIGTLADTADLVISTQNGYASKTLLTISPSASGLYYPRDLVHDAAGTALTGTSGGDRCLPLMDGYPRVTVAQGGVSMTGQLTMFYLE